MLSDEILELAKESGISIKTTKFSGQVVGADFDLEAMFAFVAKIESAARAEALDQAAKVCETKALRLEEGAQKCIEDGERDEVSSIRSSAWHLTVCKNTILKLKEQVK